jgi:hypothetical protein
MKMDLNKYAQLFLKMELMKMNIEVFQNESEKSTVGFIAKSPSGTHHEMHIEALAIDKEHRINISKAILQPKNNFWIAVVMITKNMDCSLYVIPPNTLKEPSKYSFLGKQNNKSLYWEINVFLEAITELSRFSLTRMGGLD